MIIFCLKQSLKYKKANNPRKHTTGIIGEW